jgi:hypothetical protein
VGPDDRGVCWELSKALYGAASCPGATAGETPQHPKNINILYSVAPSPYISGTFAELLNLQWPFNYLPPINEANDLLFEERIKLGFQQAMSQGFDYFFGLSLVLVSVGEKIAGSTNTVGLRPFLKNPGALWRLGRGKLKSRLARRPMMPRDLWSIGVSSAARRQPGVQEENRRSLGKEPPGFIRLLRRRRDRRAGLELQGDVVRSPA